MTFFIDAEDPPRIKGRDMPADATGFFTGLGAGFDTAALENDANLRAGRETFASREQLAMQAAERLGLDAIADWYEENAAGYDHLRPRPTTIEEAFRPGDPDLVDGTLELAREAANADPQAWADMALTDEDIESQTNARLQAEWEDSQALLDMMPSGKRAIAEFVGGMAGITLDVKNVPFLLLGGGSGSLVRIMGREAIINMSAEAAFLPSQFAMAERLDIPDPSIPEQLAMAAGAGAGIAGGMTAIGRGITYFRGRNQIQPVPQGVDVAEVEALIDEIEDALASDKPNPLEDIQIAPDREAEIADYEADVADFEAEYPEMRAQHPLAQHLKSRGGIAPRRFNSATQEWEPTPIAAELAHAGITPRTHLWLFNRNGLKDLDNLDDYSGLGDVVGMEGQYLSRQGLLDALISELSGAGKTPMTAEIAARMGSFGSRRDMELPEAVDGPFMVDRDSYDFAGGDVDAAIEADVRSFMREQGFEDILTAEEAASIVARAQRDGGDVEDMIVTALERPLDEYPDSKPAEIDLPWDDSIPEGQDDGSAESALGQGRPDPAGSLTALGAAGERGARNEGGSAFGTEETLAGTQQLVPGVRPITVKERLAREMDRPITGDQGVESEIGGLFDPFDSVRSDLFDNPAEASEIHSQIVADMRDKIETDGDFTVDMGDGKKARSASAVLDELDRDIEDIAVIELCGRTTT